MIEFSNKLLQVIKIFEKTIELCVEELGLELEDTDSANYDEQVVKIKQSVLMARECLHYHLGLRNTFVL